MPSAGVITYDVAPLQGALANAFLLLINTLFFNVKFIGHVSQYPEDYSLKLLHVSRPGQMLCYIINSGEATFYLNVIINACRRMKKYSILS